MLSDMSGKQRREEEGRAQAARLRHLAADLAHQDGRQGDTRAHCTAWNAPVRPRGRPCSTIIASVSTSVNARPSAISVKRTHTVHEGEVERTAENELERSLAQVHDR